MLATTSALQHSYEVIESQFEERVIDFESDWFSQSGQELICTVTGTVTQNIRIVISLLYGGETRSLRLRTEGGRFLKNTLRRYGSKGLGPSLLDRYVAGQKEGGDVA